MREEEVASVASKPSLAGLGSPSPSPLSCVPPLASRLPLCFCCNSPLSWPAWKEACATLQKLLSGGQLPPDMWECWSKPYIKEIVDLVKKRCPETLIVLYINGNGGLLEYMKDTGVDVIGLDWNVDIGRWKKKIG
ncbi:Uroporphyrinogen decarboxylase 1 [Arachis hypogaea]|nr:Uroporphyrinogen decarboxylase 1 [Arachis hypogaea]